MEPYEILEQEYNEFIGGGRYSVACSSGTAALHLAFETLKVTEGWYGNRVLVPSYSMIACPRAVVLAGMDPHFVDVEGDGLLHTESLRSQTVPLNTEAVLYVHTYGRQCQIESVGGLCIVEDLAEAHGVKPNPNCQAACWSFYKNKIVAGEEGGLVSFKTKEQAQVAKSLRCLGFNCNHDFWHNPRGMNYRLSNVHANLILDSLENYEENLLRRKYVEHLYDETIPTVLQRPPRSVPWVYDIVLPLGHKDVLGVVQELHSLGVWGARCGFKPNHLQPEWDRDTIQLPVAERLAATTLYLPITPEGTQESVDKAVTALEKVLGI